ncbi:response regulator transcription factor [Paenibacillus sp. GD4]|uniref:response regulator transcription factor n=1 Tax=Paenibacillus sp. GD4 TaxID=3068890 RepID=UPI0027965CF5|nr:response regulator transcription factor [Paenibacillus sp. GD4]MDQ1912500.1 response regulator transcription factor [Paenibacillus sp. GD4]
MSSDNKRVMVVEDEPEIRELILLYLKAEGFQTYTADNAEEALPLFGAVNPDLVLLDIQLPGNDGYTLCEEIRKYSNVPIIFLTCRTDNDDVIKGLKLGADDYIAKPFDPKVVMARIHSNLRRSSIFRRDMIEQNQEHLPRVLQFGPLVLDLESYSASMNGEPIPLATKEMQLLLFFAKHVGEVFSLEELYSAVWGQSSNSDTRTVMVHLSNLRKKLEPVSPISNYIHNIRGVGYKFLPSASVDKS